MTRLPLLILLLLPTLCHAQKVTMPPAVYGEVGEWILIPIKVDGGPAKVEMPEGLVEPPLWNIFPPEALKLMTGRVVKAVQPGSYPVRAWNAKGDVASDVETCKVVVGRTPVPPGPTPPGPTPPAPQSALAKALQAGYDADAEPDKAILLGVFREIVAAVPGQLTLAKTNTQLVTALKMLTDNKVGVGKLSKTRAAVGKYLNDTLQYGEMEFTEATREAYALAYGTLAKALGEVRP